VVTGTAPNPVTRVRVTGVGTSSISVGWTLPTGTVNWTNISIQYSTSATGPWINGPLLPANAKAGTITGLARHTEYFIRVQTINAAGVGTTAAVNGTTL
jgi:hypothetical protein